MNTVWTNEDTAGLLPSIFQTSDPRPAAEQLDDRYAHGGGFMATPNREDWTYNPGHPATLVWCDVSDDPTYAEVMAEVSRSELPMSGETLILFDSAMLVITQPDGTYQLTRVD